MGVIVSQMKIEINIVDAFTAERFKGNSAAVIITEQAIDEHTMQLIASENNLSETAFLTPSKDDGFNIRWFSPITEIDFCGHATLASASVLFKRLPSSTQLTFYADAIGKMTIVQKADGLISMTFPNTEPQQLPFVPTALYDGLSIRPESVLVNQQAYFAIYENEQQITSLLADSSQLKTLGPKDVVVSAKGDKVDFVSRYFWPANGGDEDPVTGSIHTGLAPYWAKVLNKTSLVAYQASKRGGTLYCEVFEDKVEISGYTSHYLNGYITI